jgi:hypothetical protein
MARAQTATRVLADLEQLFDLLSHHNPQTARERMLSGKYRRVPSEDVVLIPAIRHQTDAGYTEAAECPSFGLKPERLKKFASDERRAAREEDDRRYSRQRLMKFGPPVGRGSRQG